jgi:hypothetical protein
MTAAFQHRTTGPAYLSGRRCASPSRVLRRRSARPVHRGAGQKLASGFFRSRPAPRARKVAPQITATHLESRTYRYVFAPGCVVAPNSGATITGFQSADGSMVSLGGTSQAPRVTLAGSPGSAGNWASYLSSASGVDFTIGMTAFCGAERNLGLSPEATVLLVKMQMANAALGILGGAIDAAATMSFGSMASATGPMEGATLYRAFGNDARAIGQSWTTVAPDAVTDFRAAAGLFDGNSAEFVVTARLNTSTGFTVRQSLPGPTTPPGALTVPEIRFNKPPVPGKDIIIIGGGGWKGGG